MRGQITAGKVDGGIEATDHGRPWVRRNENLFDDRTGQELLVEADVSFYPDPPNPKTTPARGV